MLLRRLMQRNQVRRFESFQCLYSTKTLNQSIHSRVGTIGIKQASYALQSLALQVDKDEIQSRLPKVGTSDIIDLETFTRMAGSMIVQREKALNAFGLFDKDGKGLICLEDLQRVTHELGESMTDEQLQEMLDEVDGSGEGFLNQEDFLRLARNVNL
jgi:Ca2+-binding EF-hand superfamily protein